MQEKEISSTILVTGALGNVGSEVVRSLLSTGENFRAADIFPNQVIQRYGKRVEPVLFDFANSQTFSPAFRGVKKLFLMRPPQISNVQKFIFPALEAARVAGVNHVVFLSLIGVEQNKITPHYRIEQWLRQSGLESTFLRCSFFMQNFNTTHKTEIRDRDEIYLPAGNAKTSFVDARDIGAVAAQVLRQNSTQQGIKIYDLTGSDALDYFETAEIFSEMLGRKITYKNPALLAYFIRQISQGSNPFFALITTWLYGNTRRGMAARVTRNVEQLLGRAPISLRQYIKDYQDNWM